MRTAIIHKEFIVLSARYKNLNPIINKKLPLTNDVIRTKAPPKLALALCARKDNNQSHTKSHIQWHIPNNKTPTRPYSTDLITRDDPTEAHHTKKYGFPENKICEFANFN